MSQEVGNFDPPPVVSCASICIGIGIAAFVVVTHMEKPEIFTG